MSHRHRQVTVLREAAKKVLILVARFFKSFVPNLKQNIFYFKFFLKEGGFDIFGYRDTKLRLNMAPMATKLERGEGVVRP